MTREPLRTFPGSQTLARGLHGLEILANADAGITAADFARSLEVHASIGYRTLQTLAAAGLARRDNDGRFRLGLGVLALAQSALAGLRSTAAPLIRDLANETDHTAFLYIQEADEAVALISYAPTAARYGSPLLQGYRHTIERGSAGYALRSLAPPSADDPPAIQEARDRGYATSSSELTPGGWGASAPLDPEVTRVRTCVSIAGFDEELLKASTSRLCATASALNSAIRDSSPF